MVLVFCGQLSLTKLVCIYLFLFFFFFLHIVVCVTQCTGSGSVPLRAHPRKLLCMRMRDENHVVKWMYNRWKQPYRFMTVGSRMYRNKYPFPHESYSVMCTTTVVYIMI